MIILIRSSEKCSDHNSYMLGFSWVMLLGYLDMLHLSCALLQSGSCIIISSCYMTVVLCSQFFKRITVVAAATLLLASVLFVQVLEQSQDTYCSQLSLMKFSTICPLGHNTVEVSTSECLCCFTLIYMPTRHLLVIIIYMFTSKVEKLTFDLGMGT